MHYAKERSKWNQRVEDLERAVERLRTQNTVTQRAVIACTALNIGTVLSVASVPIAANYPSHPITRSPTRSLPIAWKPEGVSTPVTMPALTAR